MNDFIVSTPVRKTIFVAHRHSSTLTRVWGDERFEFSIDGETLLTPQHMDPSKSWTLNNDNPLPYVINNFPVFGKYGQMHTPGTYVFVARLVDLSKNQTWGVDWYEGEIYSYNCTRAKNGRSRCLQTFFKTWCKL